MKVLPKTKGRVAPFLFISFLGVLLSFLLTIIPGQFAWAQTSFTVTNSDDSGAGSLRQTIIDASNGGTINFSPSVTEVTLTSVSLEIAKNLTITGPVTITRGDTSEFRIFKVDSTGTGVTVGMFNLTITNGHSTSDYDGGGGLYVGYADTVELHGCTFQNNFTRDGNGTNSFGGDGGAIYNRGTLSLENCLIKQNATGSGASTVSGTMGGNGGKGGGIYNSGTLTITDSIITENVTGDGESRTGDNEEAGYGGDGAGIFSANGSVQISGSTIHNNVTGIGGTASCSTGCSGGNGGNGGGIYFDYGTNPLSIINSTISGNYTGQGGYCENDLAGDGGDGGGIYNRMHGVDLWLSFSTITLNGVGDGGASGVSGVDGEDGHGGGIYHQDGSTTLWYTILANNGTLVEDEAFGPDCYTETGGLSTNGFNLIGIEDTTYTLSHCTITNLKTTDIVNQDPGLATLQVNDPGQTPTHALKFGSPCIDAGENTAPAGYTVDQRGVDRTAQLPVDIGAFEAQHYTISGLVKDEGNQPLSGVEMQGLPDNPLTGTSGDYSVILPEGWASTVTPVKTAYTFVPNETVYDGLYEDMTDEDYVAYYVTTTHTISGIVKTSGGEGVSGVVMNGLPGNPETGSDGSYSSSVADGWTATVTPDKAGYTFTPEFREYTNVQADQTGQDYEATVNTNGDTISGKITLSDNSPLSGVRLIGYPLFGGPFTTDTLGNYEVTLPAGYAGKMSPYKAGYRFTPPSVDIDLSGGGVALVQALSSQNFTATTVTSGSEPQPVPAGTLQKDYVMSVLGVHPQTATAVGVFGIPPAEYDKTQIRIGRWNPATQGYDEYPLTGETDIRPGWTAWVLSRVARTFEVQGYAPANLPGPGGEGVYFPVKAGWNQVGNPFGHGVYIDHVRFVNQSTNDPVTFWVWVAGMEDYQIIATGGVLPSRQGGWINAPTSGWIFFQASYATAGVRSGENLVSAAADSEQPPDPPSQLNNSGGGLTEDGGGGGCFIQSVALDSF